MPVIDATELDGTFVYGWHIPPDERIDPLTAVSSPLPLFLVTEAMEARLDALTGRNPYERVKFSGAHFPPSPSGYGVASAGQGVYARAEHGQADTSSDAQRHCERGPCLRRPTSLATKADLTTSAKATVVRLYDR